MKKEGEKTLKTFNLDSNLYKEFSSHCKKHRISMSKKIENFIKGEIEKIKTNMENFGEKNKTIKEEIEHSFKKYC